LSPHVNVVGMEHIYT